MRAGGEKAKFSLGENFQLVYSINFMTLYLLLCTCTCTCVCRYGMFSSVSGILKEEMSPHLEPIIARMMESLITQEGITVSVQCSADPG